MIQVVDKALNILELLSSEPEREFPLKEIASSLRMDKGTCVNIIGTLRSRGYVDQGAPRKGYKLGYMVYRLGDSFVNNEKLAAAAGPVVNRLCALFGESVLLSVVRQDKRVALASTVPSSGLVVQTSREIPVYRATTGRMVLSYYSSEETVRFVRQYGLPGAGDWPGVDSLETMMAELERARRDGFRKDIDRNGIVGLAVPVWKGNKVVASLGVYLPQTRYSEKIGVHILQELSSSAAGLGTSM